MVWYCCRFYITSKLANPHYPPEICVKVLLDSDFMFDAQSIQMIFLTLYARISLVIHPSFEWNYVSRPQQVTIVNFTVTPQGLEDQLLVQAIKPHSTESLWVKDQILIWFDRMQVEPVSWTWCSCLDSWNSFSVWTMHRWLLTSVLNSRRRKILLFCRCVKHHPR